MEEDKVQPREATTAEMPRLEHLACPETARTRSGWGRRKPGQGLQPSEGEWRPGRLCGLGGDHGSNSGRENLEACSVGETGGGDKSSSGEAGGEAAASSRRESRWLGPESIAFMSPVLPDSLHSWFPSPESWSHCYPLVCCSWHVFNTQRLCDSWMLTSW